MPRALNHNKNKGFSIVEAALLIAIVAVIASTALPKINAGKNSDDISVAATAGQFDSSLRLARAQWFSNGQTGPGRITGFADGQVWSGERGWPVAHRAFESPSTIQGEHCASVWNGIMRDADAPRASIDGNASWQAHSDTRRHLCQYVSKVKGKSHVITYSTRTGKVSYQ